MPIKSFVRLAAALAVAVPLSTASVAFAAGVDTHATASGTQPYASFLPGATKAWCDSLPYPYCRDPAPDVPDSGPAPYADPMPDHPIFGR
jgi:hypothetical protein